MSNFDDVIDFHKKFLLPHYGDGHVPMFVDDDVIEFRHKFMQEELDEFEDAVTNRDLAKAADALVDLVYVAMGTAAMMRIPFDDCWHEVQRANMQKERATSSDDTRSVRKHSLDVVKPEGWTPPDIDKILKSAAEPKYIGLARVGKWDRRYMELARHVARWSKDPSTKVGAVLVSAGSPRRVVPAYNGFPPKIQDTDARLNDRIMKYKIVMHAERNALDRAWFDTTGATLYTTRFPCASCAGSIVTKGIGRVVYDDVPDYADRWAEEVKVARMMLDESGVEMVKV